MRRGSLPQSLEERLKSMSRTERWHLELPKVTPLAGEFQESQFHIAFRHTSVRILLERGVTVGDVAELVGDTERVLVRYYSRWILSITRGSQPSFKKLLRTSRSQTCSEWLARLMKLDDRVIEAVAAMVSGNHKEFPYRKGWEIGKFSTTAVSCSNPTIQVEKPWTQKCLAQDQPRPASSADLPSDGLVRVITELLESRGFRPPQ